MGKNNRRILYVMVLILTAFILFAGYANIKSASVVPVLMYHSIETRQDRSTPFIDPKIFAGEMEFFSKNHYNVIDPGKTLEYITKKGKMPANTILITADDGESNFYYNGYPVLKKYNIPATIFVVTDHIGMPGYLNWDQLKEMSASGLITIGSHTKSHPWLPSISVNDKALFEELAVSKEILEKGLGKKVDYLCYPNGGFNDEVKAAAKKYGYKGAFTTNPSKRSPIDDIYAVRRIKMSSTSNNPVMLWGKSSRFYAWFKERR